MRTMPLVMVAVMLAGCQSTATAPSDPPAVEQVIEADNSPQDVPVSDYTGEVTSIAIDTDMSIDDFIAIAMLVNSPMTEVKAIAVTGLFVRCPVGEEILLDFLATIGASGIPVACGQTTPVEGNRAFPNDWRDFADNAWGATLGDSSELPDPRGGVTLLTDTIRSGIDTLVILGPPSTSAQALRGNPDVAEQIPQIVMMAGAVDVPGNVYLDGYENPPWPGEWNVYVDPVATQELVDSGSAVVMVGLDATNQVPVVKNVVDRMRQEGDGAAIDFAVSTLERLRLVDAFDSYFWDQLAVAYVLNPLVVTLEQTGITVVTTPERESGRTLRDESGQTISIATGANAELFHQVMIDSLSGRAP